MPHRRFKRNEASQQAIKAGWDMIAPGHWEHATLGRILSYHDLNGRRKWAWTHRDGGGVHHRRVFGSLTAAVREAKEAKAA